MVLGSDAEGVLVDAYPGRMARVGSLMLLDFTVFEPAVEDPAPAALAEIQRMIGVHGAVAVCARIRAGSKPPPDTTRRQMEAFMAEHSEAVQPLVIILEGTGFWQATFRALLTAMLRFAKRGHGMHITGSSDEAVTLLRGARLSLPEDQLRSGYDVPPRQRR